MTSSSNVAVIMSVYKSDSPAALDDALNSLLNQTYPCDIYIYRDGKIPTELKEVLNKYIFSDSVYYFESDENRGLAKALNTLIDRVVIKEYDFIARMDSDDISRENRIQSQVKFLSENTTVDVCGSFCKEFGASYALEKKCLPLIHEELLNFSITRCPFVHPTVMFRASVFSDGHRYPESTVLTEDMAFWFELLHSDFRFANIDKVLLDYRLTEDTVIRRKGLGKALSEIRLRIKYMCLLKRFSIKNMVLIVSRIIFHILPPKVMKFLYARAR